MQYMPLMALLQHMAFTAYTYLMPLVTCCRAACGPGPAHLAFPRNDCPGRASVLETRPAQHSSNVEAVEGHHLGPRLHEVVHKLLLSVGRSIDLRHGAQLGVRAEHQVNRS